MKLIGFNPPRRSTYESITVTRQTIQLEGKKIRRAFECLECGKIMYHYVHFAEMDVLNECKGCNQQTVQKPYD